MGYEPTRAKPNGLANIKLIHGFLFEILFIQEFCNLMGRELFWPQPIILILVDAKNALAQKMGRKFLVRCGQKLSQPIKFQYS